MTDKQIIIDGVDVSGCEWYSSTYFKPCGGCKNTPNCYYKQLARKEQECEELKRNVEHWKMEHKEAKAKGEWTYDLVKKRLGKQLDQLKAENEKLEQTLAEIKEIAENVQSFVGRIDIEDDVFEQMEQILQKISECEVE